EEIIKIAESNPDVSEGKALLDIVDVEDATDEVDSLTEVTSTGGMMNSIRNFFTIKKVDTATGVTLSATGEVTKDLIKEVETELNNKEMVKEEPIIEEPKKEVVVKKQEKKSVLDFSFGKKKEVNTGIVGELNDILGLDTNKKKDKREETVKTTEVKEIKLEEKKEEVVAVKVEKKIIKKVEASEQALATYEIGVKSMFLNNAWFTKRTGILYKGDTVEQLTATNKYGCFQVKVLSSSNASSNGKIAWACEYYMVGHQASLSSYKKAANQYYSNMNVRSNKVTTYKTTHKAAPKKIATVVSNQSTSVSKIGTMHSVKTHSLKLNNESFTQAEAYLLKGDKVEQITNTNSSGCFKVSVFSSSNASGNAQGKTGWVCQKHLK
ncbi:hypothetical protein LR004_01105, partial [Candidatus Gracilibacteria bacterium]|nr:hypothetical protein [Candidatus Gracilibacteria bacterium]